jgi:hypothetical protein
MDKATKKRLNSLLGRVLTIQKNIERIIKECAKSTNETLNYWTGKEEELKKQYQTLKAVYYIIIKHVITTEYWKKARVEVKRVNELKSIDIHIDSDYKKRQIHVRTLNTLITDAYNSFAMAVDTSYKEQVKKLNDMQQAIIKVNRVENDTD